MISCYVPAEIKEGTTIEVDGRDGLVRSLQMILASLGTQEIDQGVNRNQRGDWEYITILVEAAASDKTFSGRLTYRTDKAVPTTGLFDTVAREYGVHLLTGSDLMVFCQKSHGYLDVTLTVHGLALYQDSGKPVNDLQVVNNTTNRTVVTLNPTGEYQATIGLSLTTYRFHVGGGVYVYQVESLTDRYASIDWLVDGAIKVTTPCESISVGAINRLDLKVKGASGGSRVSPEWR